MSQSNVPTKARTFPLIAGLFIVSNTVLLRVAAMWFPEIIPTLPGVANDTTVLYRLTAIGLIFGILVLLGAILLHIKPVNKNVWSIIVVVFSISSVITGGGFIIGFILGIIGGVSAFRESNMQLLTS
jgi:uncharacterized membrane protein